MNTLLWNSKSGMKAMEKKLEVISNNMANVSTTGYKRLDSSFSDLLYVSMDKRGMPQTPNEDLTKGSNGSGVKMNNAKRDNSQGGLINTGFSTDLAIDGSGYFRVNLAYPREGQTVGYTRVGNMSIDADGKMVDQRGNYIDIQFEPGMEDTKFTNDNFSVNSGGQISLKTETGPVLVGTLNRYNAIGDEAFLSVGDSLYVARPGTNVYLDTNSNVKQGYEENSNVDMGKEMNDLILTQRAFQFNSKIMTTADEMYGMVNGLR